MTEKRALGKKNQALKRDGEVYVGYSVCWCSVQWGGAIGGWAGVIVLCRFFFLQKND